MSSLPSPNSPPAAYPPVPVVASTLPRPSPSPSAASSNPWAAGGSFYLGGSGAPASMATRKAPPFKGRSSMHRSATAPSPRPAPPPSSTPSPKPSPPVLLTEGVCCCCGTTLRYPRASPSFRCTVCDTVTDLDDKARKGKAREGTPVPDATPVTEAQVLDLVRRFAERRTETDAELAHRLGALELESPSSSDDDPEDTLLALVATAFDNLPSLEGSFRPAQSSSSAPSARLPRRETLAALYDLARVRPAALNLLRGQVDALLRRPGPTLLASDGAWLVALFECPVCLPAYTPDPEERRKLLSRLIGIASNLPNSLHHALVTHLSSPTYPRHALLEKVELVCSFLSHRIGACIDSDDLGSYADDWRVRSGARVGSLLFAANQQTRQIPPSAFYVTLIDSLGEQALLQDFEMWESQSGHFSLCQYPFLLSLGAKLTLLAFDGERQMLDRASETYRTNLASSLPDPESPLLVLRVRRTHLVADSLRQISLNRLNLKKPLRVKWEDEEGIDAGGLRKEWFLLLCRQLFDPQFGMFVSDDESNLCYLNPGSLGMEDDFWLVGVVVGLAVYNAATLDVPLPLAIYKKLSFESLGLADLAQVQPSLTRGLRQLLEYDGAEGSVEDVFCRSFVGTYEAWGEQVEEELVEGGREVAVTEENRKDYVRLLVDFLLSKSVSSQFDAFAEGFHEVCAGNALSLFKARELELVVRGSTEALDVDALRGVTVYEGFAPDEPTVEAFWETFHALSPTQQRRLLAFITASDRLPATGTAGLTLKLQCLGEDCDRLPQSHTCFNTLALWRYGTRSKVERLVVRAMEDRQCVPTSRWRRPNFWLGKAIPLLLLVFAVRGYSLVVLEIIPFLWRRRPAIAALYATAVHVLLLLTGVSYFSVYFLPLAPPREREPPAEVRDKRVIFACDESGSPLRCYRDSCSGAWQSLRTRHCRDCGVCRPQFDHHCSFVNNCVCGPTLKPFACFLAYAAALLLVALVPFAPLQWRACQAVVREMWWSDEMRDAWWSGWRGWIGGPVYRYSGALLLAYRQCQRTALERPLLVPDTRVVTVRNHEGNTETREVPLYPHLATPTLSMLFVTFFATLISIIAVVMLYVVMRNARRGMTSVQGERIKLHSATSTTGTGTYDARTRLWVPLPGAGAGAGTVVLIDPDVPLFDLGAEENSKRLMGSEWWQWAIPWVPSRVSDQELNPDVVKELEARARKQL
ncbi:Proteophosphoglycan ppg4 [Rhodotorula diobovata]|uniref:HECT-type E3 ubiquitin transferase n=1 Tax=Rhodotorula diobovata TaxID=5288 RepID=A0A5C5FZP2_9BASI|nr:Proteophosphoglycan ppg4 [Rhodotorula diobovata]